MLLKEKLNIDFNEDGWDAWESEYEQKRHEAISNLQIATLNELVGNFEEGIADTIKESVLNAVNEQEDIDIVFFQEVKYALSHFIIVESDSEKDKKCIEQVKTGELCYCEFKGHEWSNYSLYYII